jgi:hypothetical protein
VLAGFPTSGAGYADGTHVSKIAEFNALLTRNAERNGFRFADPTWTCMPACG